MTSSAQPRVALATTQPAGARAQRSESGFTVVELVVAITVLAVAMVGLAQFWSSTLVATLRARQREAAVALSTQQAELLRSSGYNRLVLPVGSPTTYHADDGTTYNTLIDTTNQCASSCLTYDQTISQNKFSFDLKTIVAGIHDASDPTPGVVDYKRVFLIMSSLSGPPFTYKNQTDIHNLNKDPTVAVQGISVVMQDVDPDTGVQVTDQAGNPVTPPNDGFTIDVEGIGTTSGVIEDGQFNNFNLSPGGYTCTLTNNSTTPDWAPTGSPYQDSESFPCVVSAGQVTTVTRQWSQYGCRYTAGQSGTLQVAVTDAATSNPVGAVVTLTATNGQGQPNPSPPAITAGANGLATWSGLAIGSYTVNVSQAGYVTQTGLQTCMYNGATDALPVSLTAAPNPATVHVEVKNGSPGALDFEVQVGTLTSTQTGITKNSVVDFSLTPSAGTYTVYVYTLNCGKNKSSNLKATYSSKTFAAGQTYWLPGPLSSSAPLNVGAC